MKASKMRAKARSVFRRGRVQYRWDSDGQIHLAQPLPNIEACTAVAVIRGRVFTKPQAARR